MKRPDNCKFWTTWDVANWIVDNVTSHEHDLWGDDPIGAALWWHAMTHYSEGIRDMTQKELAFCLVGDTLKVTTRTLDDHLQAPHEDNEGVATPERSVPQIDDEVEDSLAEFFGVGRDIA